jgi:PAS domain S-box-containing protein
MTNSQKIRIDSDLTILEWDSLVDHFWPLKKGMSLFELFCEEICTAYQTHINSGNSSPYSFSTTNIFELAEELVALENGDYEIHLNLPSSVYSSISPNRIKFFKELPIGASVQDRKGDILFVNKTAQSVYGREGNVVGSSSSDISWRIQNENSEEIPFEELPALKCILENRPLEKAIIAIYNPSLKDRVWLQVSCVPVCYRGVLHAHASQSLFPEISERIELSHKNQRFLAEEDFIIKLSNGLLQNPKTNFAFQQQLIINKVGEHCETDAAFIIDIQNLQKGRPEISSWFKNDSLVANKEAILNSFIFSDGRIKTNWLEKDCYKVDRISLLEEKDTHLLELSKNNIESLLYFPVIMGKEVVAFIMLHRKINRRSFKDNDKYLLNRVTELLLSLCAQNIASNRLKESKARLNRLASNISDVVWLVNLNLEANYVSSSSKDVLGLSHSEFLEGEKGLALQEELKPALTKFIKKLVLKKSTDKLTLALQSAFLKDGKEILLSHKVRGDYDENDRLNGLIICSSDETELHQTFLQLKEREDKYRSLFENSPLGLMLFHPIKGILECNKSAASSLKYTINELKRHNIEELSPEFQPNGLKSADLIQEHKKLVAQGKKINFEWVHLDSTGKAVIMNVHLSNIGTKNENLILASWQDISQIRQNEDRLFRLNTAVENSPVSMVITNLKAEIEYVNPAVIKTTGYSKEELLGKNPRVLQSGNTPKKSYQQMWDSLTQNKEWRGVFCNKRKNGELYWERVHISPVLNGRGELTHYLAVKEDITLIKQYLEAIEKQNDLLKEIAWTESHVLRAPLARLLGLLQLYREGVFDDEMSPERVLQLMEESALEMDGIIENINTQTYQQRHIQNLIKQNPLNF